MKVFYSKSSGIFRGLCVLGIIIKTALFYVQCKLFFVPHSTINRKLGVMLREDLGSLKGPLQKLGQMLSYLFEDLPVEFREEMRKLIYDSPPVDSRVIRKIIEEELHLPVREVFAQWDDNPIATGSIGQIHKAQLKNGTTVAVKVLLPDLQKILCTDLFFLSLTIPLVKLLWRTENLHEIFEELKRLLLAECDFENEKRNMEIFRWLFRDSEHVIIPEVFPQFCTKKVLVMEYIAGKNFDQFISQATTDEKRYAAEIIWDFFCKANNRFCIFHADPHPGNYVFVDRKIAVLDYGFCKTWTVEFIDSWKYQTIVGCEGKFEQFVTASKRLGFVSSRKSFDYGPLYNACCEIYEIWIKDQDFHFTHANVKKKLRMIYRNIIANPGLRIRTEFVALSRVYWGVFVVMAELDAKGNYHSLTMPYIREATESLESQINSALHQ